MKRVLAAFTAALVLTLGSVSVATAQDTTTEESSESDNTGLWGLAGLLGLAGLAGLKRRDDRIDTTRNRRT